MSRFRTPAGDDHPEAASKHLEDADALISGARFDGGAYLAGYVVECTLKTIALVEGGNPWGHDLNALSTDALRLLALPGARSHRYQPRMTSGHPMYGTAGGWKETLRYRAEGFLSPADASEWVEEARRVFQSVIVPMRFDGVL